MELIEQIKQVLKTDMDSEMLFDLTYDTQGYIHGYVASEKFANKSEKAIQKEIWAIIAKYIGKQDLKKILALMSETIEERFNRLNDSQNEIHPNQLKSFWKHVAPDKSIFYAFVDAGRIGEIYQSFYLVINIKRNLSKGLVYNYTEEVVNFMKLDGHSVYKEILNNAINGAKTTIEIDLMKSYEAWSEKGLYGKENQYNYIFQNFALTPINIRSYKFTIEETDFIMGKMKSLPDLKAKFDLKESLLNIRKIKIREI
jgi:hypothetical protein